MFAPAKYPNIVFPLVLSEPPVPPPASLLLRLIFELESKINLFGIYNVPNEPVEDAEPLI
jgi:hypothetical protein